MSLFKQNIIKIVNTIPYGKVMSYGQVAAVAGVPRAARQVGMILNKYRGDEELVWWRVVNNQGRITIKGSLHNADDQKDILESEGLKIKDDYTFNIVDYRYIPSVETLKTFQLNDDFIDELIRKYSI